MLPTLSTAVVTILLLAGFAEGSTLVGTVQESANPDIGDLNPLISTYNTDFATSLPQIQVEIDKIEDQLGVATFQQANLSVDDFDFFAQDDLGSKSVFIFDATVKFGELVGAFSFDDLDNPVQGYEWTSGSPQSYDYYVSKDGELGWSLWYAGNGFNPAYTDSAADGFTRGNTSDDSLSYDPITRGISHIAFFSSIPEPSTLALLCVGVFGFLTYTRRRRK